MGFPPFLSKKGGGLKILKKNIFLDFLKFLKQNSVNYWHLGPKNFFIKISKIWKNKIKTPKH